MFKRKIKVIIKNNNDKKNDDDGYKRNKEIKIMITVVMIMKGILPCYLTRWF